MRKRITSILSAITCTICITGVQPLIASAEVVSDTLQCGENIPYVQVNEAAAHGGVKAGDVKRKHGDKEVGIPLSLLGSDVSSCVVEMKIPDGFELLFCDSDQLMANYSGEGYISMTFYDDSDLSDLGIVYLSIGEDVLPGTYDIDISVSDYFTHDGENIDNPVAESGSVTIIDESDVTYDPYLTIEKVDSDEDGVPDYVYISDCEISATDIEIPSEVDGLPVTIIGDGAFMSTNLKSITISGNVNTIGMSAFSSCPDLKVVTINENVTKIEDGAFSDCHSLNEVIIKNPECEISGNPFTYGCTISGYDNSTVQAYAQEHGYTFKSLGEAPVIDSEPDAILGDANGDGKLNVRDAAYIAKMLAQNKAGELPENADFNGDGKVNVRDAAAIAKHLATGKND